VPAGPNFRRSSNTSSLSTNLCRLSTTSRDAAAAIHDQEEPGRAARRRKPEVKKRNLCEECDRTKKKLLVASRDSSPTPWSLRMNSTTSTVRSVFSNRACCAWGRRPAKGAAPGVWRAICPVVAAWGLRPTHSSRGEEHQRSVGHPAGGGLMFQETSWASATVIPCRSHLSASCQ